MAINPNDTITYRVLKNNVLAWIKSIPHNVGSYKSDVHASLKAGWTKVYASKDYYWEYRKNYNYNKRATSADRYKTHIDLTATVNSNTVIPVVTATQIENDFNAFLNTAKINNRLDGIVTTSGLLNFWDNVICFLYRHLVNVCSNEAPNGVLMYWSASTYSYQYVTKLTDNFTTKPSETKITAQDMKDMLTTLENTYNFAHRTHVVTFSITKNAIITNIARNVAPYAKGYDCPEGGPSGW